MTTRNADNIAAGKDPEMEPNLAEAHWDRVRRQYDDADGAPFYRAVMGDGGDHVHYGLFESDNESVGEAALRATTTLASLANRHLALGPGVEVADFGSGNGGPAHSLALDWGVGVTCINLCPRQNETNRRRCRELGVAERVAVMEYSFERLPKEWSDRFDVVWSQESLCHAADKAAAFSEEARLLRRGGIVAMSDILAADEADAARLAPFTERNAVVRLDTRKRYVELFQQTGFEIVAEYDWSGHLAENFARMLRQIHVRYEELAAAGVRRAYLDEFADALRRRLAAHDNPFRWAVFVARKPA